MESVVYGKLGGDKDAREAMMFLRNFLESEEITMEKLISIHFDNNIAEESDIQKFMHSARYELFISSMSWDSTDDGVEYWDRISSSWEQALAQNIGELKFFEGDIPGTAKQIIFKDNSDLSKEFRDGL